MAVPFLDNIAGLVTGAATTAAFTPTSAYTNALAWSTVPIGGVYSYRAEEAGVGWEIGLGIWNGTTLTRNVILSSNANGLVSFGANVIISLTEQADEVMPHIGGSHWGLWQAKSGGTTIDAMGLPAPTITGTAAAVAVASTNSLTRRQRLQLSSATTASAIAGLSNASSGSGLLFSTDAADVGFEFVARLGCSALPTGPRFLIGLSAGVLSTVDPSTLNNTLAIGKDVADTNWQLIRRSATALTKTDLGFAPAANVPYEVSIYKNPGNQDIVVWLIALDGSQQPKVVRVAAGTANSPVNNTVLFPVCQGSVGTATGTALVMHFQHLFLRDLA
jgi:hypothetical protein